MKWLAQYEKRGDCSTHQGNISITLPFSDYPKNLLTLLKFKFYHTKIDFLGVLITSDRPCNISYIPIWSMVTIDKVRAHYFQKKITKNGPISPKKNRAKNDPSQWKKDLTHTQFPTVKFRSETLPILRCQISYHMKAQIQRL